MVLHEFIKEEKKRLEIFRDYWIKSHLKDPDNFPLDNEEGMWYEQLMIFDE